MGRSSRGRSQAFTLISGVVLSTILGVFFYFKTDLTTAVATFAGLVGTTITLQIESLIQEREARDMVTRQQRLFQRIEMTPWLPRLLDEAVESYADIEHDYGGTMALKLARKAFEDCHAQLAELARGRYGTFDGDESPNSPLNALTEAVRQSLLATSSGDDVDWWLDNAATRNYWRLNVEAAKRGVPVKRIFIYREWTDQIKALADAHFAAGVQVFRVAERDLPPVLCINIVIWDEQCGLVPQHNAAGEWIASNFTFAPQDLALLLDRFALIESFAERWPPDVPDERMATGHP